MKASTHERPTQYLVDTAGAWMLEGLFDDDLRALEFRSREYLASLINAYCDPSSELIGIAPNRREELLLPGVYKALRNTDGIGSVASISANDLETNRALLEAQFELFMPHLIEYPATIERFTRFHTHPKVSPGFFGASGHEERIPGVPDFVEDFLSGVKQRRRLDAAGDAIDRTAVMQAFAIFQRGFKYANAAEKLGAGLLTHPLRWSCVGRPTEERHIPVFAYILGGIAAVAIRKGEIKSAAHLCERLNRLRAQAAQWRSELDALQAEWLDAGENAIERKRVENEIEERTDDVAATWIGGELAPEARKSVVELLAGTFAGALRLAGLENVETVISAVAIRSGLTLFITPMWIGPLSGRFLRPWVHFDTRGIGQQSCGHCGEPLDTSKGRPTCRICCAVVGDTWNRCPDDYQTDL